MPALIQWLVAVAVTTLIGTVATVYFRNFQMRRDETAAGIVALSGVSWRTFIHMVLDALSRRGFECVVDADATSVESNFVLEHKGQRYLLSCKHGSAFVLGQHTVDELANDINLQNAVGGFLLTQGRITDDVRPNAAQRHIELLDGQTLWPQLRNFLPSNQLDDIRAKAAQTARQRILLSWLAALLAGVAVFVALPNPPTAATYPSIVVQPLPGVSSEPMQDSASIVEAGAIATEASTQPQSGSSAQRRKDVASAISTLPDVDRAIWSSESTLQVFLLKVDGDAFTRICPLIERFDELASSRIQLTPPQGSDARVRFRQCRSY